MTSERLPTLVRRVVPLLLALLVVAGCGDESPRPVPQVPAVVLERATDAAGTAFRRLSLAPDLPPTFSDGDRHAWSLAALFGPHAGGGDALLEVGRVGGGRVELPRPFAPEGGGVWVLRANRRGDARLELVDAAAPFPPYHGRGGNRGRSGAAGRRIEQVERLRLRTSGR